MKKKKGEKVDNSCAALKAQLRRAYLPPDARVLDLFAGHGEMYRRAYAGNVSNYYGVDKQIAHDAALCAMGDNIKYVCQNDITKYNVFDLDAYGIPWDLFFLIIKRLKMGEYTFFLTDGLPVQLDKSRGYLLSKIIRATERFARRFTVRGSDRAIDLATLAGSAQEAANLPEGMSPGLGEHVLNITDVFTFPSGCHVAEVEIDPETGAIDLLRYAAVDDYGRLINPMLTEGQVLALASRAPTG